MSRKTEGKDKSEKMKAKNIWINQPFTRPSLIILLLHNRFVLLHKWILTVLADDVSCYSVKESAGPWMKSVSHLRGEESNKTNFFNIFFFKKAGAFCLRVLLLPHSPPLPWAVFCKTSTSNQIIFFQTGHKWSENNHFSAFRRFSNQ